MALHDTQIKQLAANAPTEGSAFPIRVAGKRLIFSKDCLEKRAKWFDGGDNPEPPEGRRPKRKGHFEKRKVVRFKLKPNRAMMAKRMCMSEHPFGTIKQWLSSGFFLLKGLKKVGGEFALFALSYNMARAENMFTFQELMAKVGG